MAIDLAVLLVAGQGTRLLPATKSQPKEMLPVGRKPAVQYVVEELVAANIRRICFVTGPGKASIENHFDINAELVNYLRITGREEQLAELDFEREHVEYFYTRQRRQLGSGHAVLCAKSFVGRQPFVLALGDSIIGMHAQSAIVQQMQQVFEKEQADLVIAVEEVPAADVVHYGVVKPRGNTDDVFVLDDLMEKPRVDEAASNLAVAARYVCSPAIFDYIGDRPDRSGEIQFTDAIRGLIRAGGKVLAVRLPAEERRYDIGNFESYFRTFVEFALADPRYGDALREHLQTLLAEG